MMEQIRPEQLITRLGSANEGWRVDAEARLVSLGQAAVQLLINALGHAYPQVRLHAATALSRIGDPRGIPAVVRLLGDTENRGAAAIAAEKALVGFGAAAVEALLEASLRGPEEIRPRALRALGQVATKAQAPAIEGLLLDPSPAVRTQAGVALCTVLGEGAIEKVAPLLIDLDKWVRYGVAEALVKIGCTRGRKALQEAHKDPEEAGSYVTFWAEDLLDEIDELERLGRAIP
jgi:HEAT repeat protein